MAVAGLSTGALLVFALIGVALVLFVSETFPSDVTAIGIVVAIALAEPWVGLTPTEAISGFSNPATITIVAMYMLSAGVQQTGIVEHLGVRLASFTRGDPDRALLATVCTTGPIAGVVNNTPVVAVFIPLVQDLARDADVSPSKLLLPLSYAAILGGTLTLIGTATNILASDVAGALIPGRDGIGMFEFTPLGIVVLVVGIAYLLTIGRALTPARVPVDADPLERFDMEDHLGRVVVRAESPLVGRSVDDIAETVDTEIALLQLRRDGEVYALPDGDATVRPDDRLIVHGTLQAINRFRETNDLRHLHREDVTAATFDEAPTAYTLATAIVPENSEFVGETWGDTGLERFHRTSVLAVRREGVLYRTDLAEIELQPGDHLLLRTTPETIEYFADSPELWLVDERVLEARDATDPDSVAPLTSRTPLALSIVLVVVFAAAATPAPVVITALGGVFAMLATGCLSPSDAYDAVSWNVIFLLAGVIPLGLAMERTGGATAIADALATSGEVLPALAVLYLFYVVTSTLANVITPVATVVLMLPVAVDTALQLGASPFAFLLAVTFAGATAFMTPIGYQTNLMVYGPGGYKFTDFLRVGAPLQLLLSVVTTVGIWAFWGV
ncbi:SLC13 family permease [Salinarchaeum laminariae]|uniref:SLC13 family permease n=1 Tax=Salinarchaeum laminariae TaxID=869888 RepID=UPI0020BF556D|nr:SLC13 family permease [Salinarchaeum laminariae]